MISRPHWAKNTLYKTVNRSLCARCLFISWSQVCVTYYQTRMTMVDSSGGMSRSILSQLVKLTGSVQFQNPPFPVLKLSFWQRQDFRNIPGILFIRAHSVAWLSSKYIKINSHPLYLRYYGEAKTKKKLSEERKNIWTNGSLFVVFIDGACKGHQEQATKLLIEPTPRDDIQ